jgi:hypothetical protein
MDRSTMTQDAPTQWRLRFAARATATVAWMWFGIAIPFVTDVVCDMRISLALAGTWLVLAFFVAACFLVLATFGAEFSLNASYRCCVIAVLPLFMALVFAFTDYGLIVRLKVCETWLDDYANAVPPGTSEWHEPRTAGLFYVERTRESRGCVFLYTGAAFMDQEGIARIPPGARLPPRVYIISHLSGDWHRFGDRF